MTVAASEPNDRSPITVSSGAAVTSTTGAKSMVTPSARIWRPRSSAMPYTSSGVLVWASTRGDDWLPIRPASRDTRPPSSSTLTASGSGPAEPAMSASEPSDSIDRSVQLPIMMPPTWWSATTARASAAPVTPTISSCASLSRVDMAASTSPQAGGAGAAGNGTFSGVLGVAGAAVVVGGLGYAGEHANNIAGNAASAVPVCRSEANRVRLRGTGIRPWCHSARS